MLDGMAINRAVASSGIDPPGELFRHKKVIGQAAQTSNPHLQALKHATARGRLARFDRRSSNGAGLLAESVVESRKRPGWPRSVHEKMLWRAGRAWLESGA